MNIVVFGAGAIGSLYAAKLSAHHAVIVIARPGHAEAIARDGLRVIGRESFTCQLDAAVSVGALLPDDPVDEVAGRPRQHESGEPVDEHQRETEGEPAAMLPDEESRLLPGVGVIGFRFLVCHGEKVTQSQFVAPPRTRRWGLWRLTPARS